MKSDEISSPSTRNLQRSRGLVFFVSVTVSSGGFMANTGGGWHVWGLGLDLRLNLGIN
ncbi:hypothetical protein TIFTF001_019682 [Ficus carica]|uniref:Uncharacterized protein n=1 Tax=Ficus carica TaxID=3494 RepID=A0AA88AQS4_FICCA|nr:hypothetical protein TIFTF001_019682 [Ficus carica]